MTWPDCAVMDIAKLFIFWDTFSSKDGGDTFVQQTRLLSTDDTAQVTTLLNYCCCLEKKLKASRPSECCASYYISSLEGTCVCMYAWSSHIAEYGSTG